MRRADDGEPQHSEDAGRDQQRNTASDGMQAVMSRGPGRPELRPDELPDAADELHGHCEEDTEAGSPAAVPNGTARLSG